MPRNSEIDHDRLTSLWHVLDYHASETPDAIALKFEGTETSYRDLRRSACALAARLAKERVRSDDRVAYLGKNNDRYIVLLYALARIGAVLVPLNWRLADAEWQFIVQDAQIVRLFVDDLFLEAGAALAAAAGLAAPSRIAWDDALLEPDARLPRADDTVFQVYTSGTTGRPKGAMLTHRNMLALRAPGYRAGLVWYPDRRSVSLAALPVAHIAGTAYVLFGLYGGGRVVITREFDPDIVLELLETEQASHILLAPAAMQQLMDSPKGATTDLSHLDVITYGAAPIPEAQLRQAIEFFGCGFVQMYGMSEAAGGVVALTPDDHLSGIPGRLRSAGRAMPGVEVATVDEGGVFLRSEEVGEIVIRSQAVMAGYWNRPDATREATLAAGWFRSGDIGHVDSEGYVFVLDRAKDMIVSGGENVYPAEVENAIFGHPDVADVAVIGVPSARWGEEVMAIIVPRQGRAPTLETISAWVEGKIARFKVPKQIHLADALPRNAGNKILRRELREPFWAGLERRVN